MMRHVTIGALIGFGLTVLALVLWGGGGSGNAPPPPPVEPPSAGALMERPLRNDSNALRQAAMRDPSRRPPLRRRGIGDDLVLDRGTPPAVAGDAGAP